MIQKMNSSRNREVRTYGRDFLYKKLLALVPSSARELFKLVNVSLTNIDDILDAKGDTEILLTASTILRDSFQGKSVRCDPIWKKDIRRLGFLLGRQDLVGNLQAGSILEEIIKFWISDIKNHDRKGMIISSAHLCRLNKELGGRVALQFFYICCPNIPKKDLTKLGFLAGLAVKTADNLSDLKPDFQDGFINISKEEVRKYKMQISEGKHLLKDQKNLHLYKLDKLKEIKHLFYKSDREFRILSEKYTEYNEILDTLKTIFVTWFIQAQKSI